MVTTKKRRRRRREIIIFFGFLPHIERKTSEPRTAVWQEPSDLSLILKVAKDSRLERNHGWIMIIPGSSTITPSSNDESSTAC
jgi:hypothetical protein